MVKRGLHNLDPEKLVGKSGREDGEVKDGKHAAMRLATTSYSYQFDVVKKVSILNF